MKKILITDPVDPKCADILRNSGHEVDFKSGISPDELKKIIHDYNGLIVRSETKVNESLISFMDSMEIIGRAGAGTDNIDLNAATRKGIIVMNAPGGNTISAAEHTMALMLSICRNVPQANISMREGKWERKKFTGSELSGKTLFVIGLGKIGKEVAIRSHSFGMEIIAFDPVISPTSLFNTPFIKLVSLDEGLSRADIITLHVPLTDNTRNLISSTTLERCKKGVRIINCSRGGIVNEKDVIEFIDKGLVASAAFDVFEKEPVDPANPVITHPKIICTPHLGASTEEAQEKVAVQIADQISSYFSENVFAGGVNIPFQKIDDKLMLYIDLAEKIGYLQSRFLKSSLKEIKIQTNGDLLHINSAVISSAVLKGFLSETKTIAVNLINAPYLLKESGITLREEKSTEEQNLNNLITVNFIYDSGEKIISGTVFGEKEKRILQIDNHLVEFNPEGNFLIYYNEDKPGVLASVSGLLAESGLNISVVSLGRDKTLQKALTVIGVDNDISDVLIKKTTGINGVQNVYQVKFRGTR